MRQAALAAKVDLTEAVSVFGSALGEIQRMDELLATPPDQPLSPIRFQLSVHNTTAGLSSVALSCHAPSTSISAGPDTTAAALWEASALLADGAPQVVVVLGEESGPLRLGAREYLPFAAAFVFGHSSTPTGLALSPPQHIPAPKADWNVPQLRSLRDNPCRAAALVVQALARGVTTSVPLAGEGGRALTTQLERSTIVTKT